MRIVGSFIKTHFSRHKYQAIWKIEMKWNHYHEWYMSLIYIFFRIYCFWAQVLILYHVFRFPSYTSHHLRLFRRQTGIYAHVSWKFKVSHFSIRIIYIYASKLCKLSYYLCVIFDSNSDFGCGVDRCGLL